MSASRLFAGELTERQRPNSRRQPLRIAELRLFAGLILLASAQLAHAEPAPPPAAELVDAGAPEADAAPPAIEEPPPDPFLSPPGVENLDDDDDEPPADKGLPPAADLPPSAEAGKSPPIRYILEGVRVRGNSTRTDVIAHFVPIEPGELLDVDDPSIESIRWRLLGTGWFEDVKLSLARGSRRGAVVLVIDVRERNTLVIDRVVLGLSSVVTSSSSSDIVRPYAGLGIAENNLFGLGIGVRGAAAFSMHENGIAQYGVDFGYLDPMLRGTGFSLTGRVFHNYAREFFGRNPLVAISCPTPEPGEEFEECDPDVEGKRAVVIYHRTGIGIGTGHDISSQLRYTLDWLGEYVDVTDKPTAASTQRGNDVVPIDFRIDDGTSFVSSLRLGFIYDRRDHPALTTRGTTASFYARLASALIGSSYDFARFEGTVRHWVPLPWNHVISFGLFLGTVFGDAPFFYDFYAADLSDLLPSRVLELNVDRRRTLNLLGTSIVEMDMEDLAGRIDFEYQLPIYRGGGVIHGIDAYAGAGIFMLTSRRDLRVSISGYEGFSRIPIDLTFDFGVQADTEIGVFKLGFSSLIGFSQLGQENP
ncbi:MAG TPA: BamA/TamA family outer membrane protein [Polyangiales bacterium]|nr:BamA/TamA family outer membrane protein [Polyangiales bacterium]